MRKPKHRRGWYEIVGVSRGVIVTQGPGPDYAKFLFLFTVLLAGILLLVILLEP